ncbi:fructose-1-6-bisphosphatase [Xylariaceae sp. FL0804]|nr:fructose-1-6-bisphosphatase [Xylariaceae sp. FL0804]
MAGEQQQQPPSSDLQRALRAAAPSGVHSRLIEGVIPALIDAVAAIAAELRRAHAVSAAGGANAFGDDQLNVDVLAERAVRESLARCPAVVTASSEEDPVERPAASASASSHPDPDPSGTTAPESEPEEHYAVAFDPLDGSSIIGANFAVGSIFGVWQGRSVLGGAPPSERQVAAVLGVYGPRTTALVAVRVPGCNPACLEIGVDPAADSSSGSVAVVLREDVALAEGEEHRTRYFAPANLRAASEDARYLDLVTALVRERYTLRYSGGLVPDVAHALAKGQGLYVSPVAPGSRAKLRRAYELCPVALVVECAGGSAVDPADGRRILDRTIDGLEETGGLICGNKEEVRRARDALLA